MNIRSKTLIDLLKGWPSPSLLPPDALKTAASIVLSDCSISIPTLQYGPDEGYQPLREEIARWLTSFYHPRDAIKADRICITGGASQNLACILQTFTDPVYTRNIWMIAPTYYLACRIFDDSGFAGKLKGIPEDEEGADVDVLLKHIAQSERKALRDGNIEPKIKPSRPWRRIYRHVIYAVPTFANPSGRLMSLNRRESLVRIARRFDALIITDDVYDFLQWPSSSSRHAPFPSQAHVPRVVDVDRYLGGGPIDAFGNAVSSGSLSKIVGPGCRTGWAEGAAALVYGLSQTGSSRSGGCPSQLVASCVHQLLATNALQRHILHLLQPAYARRYHAMMTAITQHLLPLGLSTPDAKTDVAGGYFVWLKLPGPLRSEVVARKAAEEEDLIISDGTAFQVQGDEESGNCFDSNIRLCFSYETEENLVEGVERLARLIRGELDRMLDCAPGAVSAGDNTE